MNRTLCEQNASTLMSQSGPPPRSSDSRLQAAETALTEVLTGKVLGTERAGDRQRAASLVRALDVEHGDSRVFAAALGAVSAAWDEAGRWDAASRETAIQAARGLPARDAATHRTALAALSVCLMAFGGFSADPAADTIRGANILRSVERHDLCSWAARKTLRSLTVTDSQRARALILIAVVDRDIAAGREAMRIARLLPPDDPGRRMAESLWGKLSFLDSGEVGAEVSDAVETGDRARLARHMAATIAKLRTPQADDALLRGLHRAVMGLAGREIQATEVRLGMREAIGHWRERHRTGTVPPVAKAGIENVINLLKLDLTGAAPQLLFEIVEALADHGLSDLNGTRFSVEDDIASAALIHAEMSASTASEVRWPNFPWIVGRLGTTHVVLTHTRRRYGDKRFEVDALQLRPPTYPALNQISLEDAEEETLRRLASQRLESIDEVSGGDLETLIGKILPPTTLASIEDGAMPPVIVPDGPLRAIPWHAISDYPVIVAPSMTMWASMDPPVAPIRRVIALVDEGILGSEILFATLAGAGLTVTRARSRRDLSACQDHDLLVIFCHGEGDGLDYHLQLPEGPLRAVDLAGASLPPRAVIASCRSAHLPPVSLPLSVPTALLLAGCRTVAGGLWPLPVVPTAEIVADTLAAVGGGSGLATSLKAAQLKHAEMAVADRLGLAVFGIADPQ